MAEASTLEPADAYPREFVACMRVLGVGIPEAGYSSLATPDGCVDYLCSRLER